MPLKALSTALDQRLKHPLVGSFILSWLAFNWKPIVTLLLSQQPIESRITYINNCFNSLQNLLWWPLGLALFYSILLPYITVGINKLLKKANQNRINELRQEEKDSYQHKVIIAQHEYKLEAERAGRKETQELNDRIEELEKLYSSEQEKATKLIQELRQQTEELVKQRDTIKQLTKTIEAHEKTINEKSTPSLEDTIKKLSDQGVNVPDEVLDLPVDILVGILSDPRWKSIETIVQYTRQTNQGIPDQVISNEVKNFGLKHGLLKSKNNTLTLTPKGLFIAEHF